MNFDKVRTTVPARSTFCLAMTQIGWPLGELVVGLFGMATLDSFHNKTLGDNNNWATFSMTLPSFGVTIDTLKAKVEVRLVWVLRVF